MKLMAYQHPAQTSGYTCADDCAFFGRNYFIASNKLIYLFTYSIQYFVTAIFWFLPKDTCYLRVTVFVLVILHVDAARKSFFITSLVWCVCVGGGGVGGMCTVSVGGVHVCTVCT